MTRVGLLPPWWLLPLLVAAVFATIRLTRLTPVQISPLFGAAVVLLPWLPFSVPPAALLWTGPFMAAVWVVVAASVARTRWPDVRSPWLTDAPRATILAAAMALVLYGASAWWLAPILPDGDAPHYLILAQSLVKDGDLQIENNHRRGDYLEYSLLAAQPDYLRRGVNGAIYSIHAPGLPALIAPAMWLFGYPGAVAFLGIVAALSTALVWWHSYQITGSASASWFGWVCCALTTPFFFQATQVFPDGLAATCVLLGASPLMLADRGVARGRAHDTTGRHDTALWLLSGASLAILPWLQTRLAIVAAAAACCVCLRMRSVREFVTFAALPIVSALAWFAFFFVVYGTPNPTAPYGTFTQTTVANLWRGVPGILFDAQFGLLANAPVFGVVLVGVLARAANLQRWSWELLALVVPYTIGVGMYQHWWGGASAPARLLAPITLVLAIGGARVWHDARTRATRIIQTAALAVSVLIAVLLLVPDTGRLLINFRDGIALWAEWSNDSIDLPRGLPSLFMDDPGRAVLKASIWGACILVSWFTLQVLDRRFSDSRAPAGAPLLSSAAIWCLTAAPMIALTLVWRTGGVQPLTPARSAVGLLRQASASRPIAYDFGMHRFEPSRDALSRVRVRSDAERPRASPAHLLSALAIPAGTYRLHLTSVRSVEGTLTLRLGDTLLPYWSAPAAGALLPASELSVRLPVDVRSLVVEGDAAALRSISSVELEPVHPAESSGSAAAGGTAHRGVRYASSDTFFLDENAYPEPTGFWVAGGRTARTVIASEGQKLELFLRNAPVDNTVVIDIDGERHELTLGPREERVVALARVRPGPYASVRVTSRSGFRPSELDTGSRDLRYLGCWVEPR